MKNTNKILVLLSAIFPLVACEDEGAGGGLPQRVASALVDPRSGPWGTAQGYRVGIAASEIEAALRQATIKVALANRRRPDGSPLSFARIFDGTRFNRSPRTPGEVQAVARRFGEVQAIAKAIPSAVGAMPEAIRSMFDPLVVAASDVVTGLSAAGRWSSLLAECSAEFNAHVEEVCREKEAAFRGVPLSFVESAEERVAREEREVRAAAERAAAEATDQARRDRVEQERVEAAMRASLSRGHAAGAGEEEAAVVAGAGAEGSGSGGEGGGVRAPDPARVERLLPAGMASQDDLAEVARVEGAGAGLPPFTQAVIEAAIAGESEAIALMQAHAAKGSEAAQSLSEALGLSGRSVPPTPAPPVAVAAADDGAAGPGGALPPMSQALTEAALTGDHRAIEAIRHYAAEGNAAALRALDFLEPEGVAPTLAGRWDAPSVDGGASAGRAPAPMINEALIQRALMGEVAAQEIIRERAAGGDLAALQALEFIS